MTRHSVFTSSITRKINSYLTENALHFNYKKEEEEEEITVFCSKPNEIYEYTVRTTFGVYVYTGGKYNYRCDLNS